MNARIGLWVAVCLFSGGLAGADDSPQRERQAMAHGTEAEHRAIFELALQAEEPVDNPYFDVQFTVQFQRPDGSRVDVEGFYDGERQFKARAYCDTVGEWTYRTESDIPSLHGQTGRFRVRPSDWPGKLRIHSADPRQFAYDDGSWFLHIGDTGYRFVVESEPEWQAYIDQAAEAGFTKIRTWFAQSRSTVEALYTPDRKRLNLGYWQEIEQESFRKGLMITGISGPSSRKQE